MCLTHDVFHSLNFVLLRSKSVYDICGPFDPALVVTIHLQGNFSIFCLMPFLLEGKIFLFSF